MPAQLSVEAGAAQPPVVNLSGEGPVSLGRNRGNTVVLNDQHASRFHAELFFVDGAWYLRDCGTTNGTRLNGERLRQEAALADGHEIAIGDVRFRFRTESGKGSTAEMPILASDPPTADLHTTLLQADEMTALLEFAATAGGETTTHDVVHRALALTRSHTRASVCGFLSFDAEDPLPKVVLPADAKVDTHLSRQLTQQALAEGRSVWLAAPTGPSLETESLMGFQDALCVPLRRARPAGAGRSAAEAPLGALHIYKTNRRFSEREVHFCEVLAGHLANTLHVLRSHRALEADNTRLRVFSPRGADDLVGESAVMAELRSEVRRLAETHCTVLIDGESGTGKELVALGLHRNSPRRDGPLVTVNCAAITSTMSEAELFGYKKGAFTGALADREGFFAQADTGTLFLDEIGEMSLECQARLLRVLETKSFRPLMGTEEIKVDVRVIAATNRDLEKEVRAGRFRRDLFFRLGAHIRVPPLRDHAEDIPELVEHFLTHFQREYRRRVRLSEGAMRRLQTYSWPGNVRQLRSVLETPVAMARTEVVQAADLHLLEEEGQVADRPPSLNLEELEAWAIREAMTRTGSVQTHAARLLGIHRDTLINKLRKYGIGKD